MDTAPPRRSRSGTLEAMLLRCFPPAWRDRYGEEFRALLDQRELTLSWAIDILRAALDARLHPRPLAAAAATPGPPPGDLFANVPPPKPAALAHRSHGEVPPIPLGLISRRTFLRRALGTGTVLLSLEFLGGTIAFLWPRARTGIGIRYKLGTLADLAAAQPSFLEGWPYSFGPARTFLINVPAAKELASGRAVSVPNPTAGQLLALWRRCPHLGCQVPALCDEIKRFTCRCHGSTYNILGEKLKEGPAQRGMDRFPVTIDDDGMVELDTTIILDGPPNRGLEHLAFVDPFPYDLKCE